MTALEEIKKALEGVTVQEWTFDGPADNIIIWCGVDTRVCFMTSDGPAKEHAQFITACQPAAISELLSTLERLQRENEELRQRQLAWRSMDSAPKDGKHCILSIPSGGFVYTVQGAFMGGKWINALNVDAEPLAWMPNVLLPDAYCPWKRPFSVPLASTGGEHHAE